jgi:hypothetical protein
MIPSTVFDETVKGEKILMHMKATEHGATSAGMHVCIAKVIPLTSKVEKTTIFGSLLEISRQAAIVNVGLLHRNAVWIVGTYQSIGGTYCLHLQGLRWREYVHPKYW